VLGGHQQQLDRLPFRKAARLQRRRARRLEPVARWRRLQRVQAAELLVDEGERRRLRLEEEGVVVAADGAVEGGELDRVQVRVVARVEVV